MSGLAEVPVPAWLLVTPWLVLDVETTGTDPGRDRIVQIAAVARESGNEMVRVVSSLVNPGIPIPPEATAVHGITDDTVRDAPTLAELLPAILQIGRGRTVLGYNVAFDLEFARLGWPSEAVDPLVWVRGIDRWVPGKGRHKLAETCRRWGVEMRGHAHAALTDARACWDLWWTLVYRNRDWFPERFDEMLEKQRRMRAEQEREFAAYKARMAAEDAARGA